MIASWQSIVSSEKGWKRSVSALATVSANGSLPPLSRGSIHNIFRGVRSIIPFAGFNPWVRIVGKKVGKLIVSDRRIC